ncbi:alpha/beta hydrolase [Nocardia sp. NRRL WC-3656]|uniref:alpha/beta hydrolase n=1 Tax=Nocardia sp. NRRL WC-3656 TaxID=1463824 RepID=UPI0004C3B890|nr:alpha/beta hydrolase [Nocardia sp. NRRL WC-3656]
MSDTAAVQRPSAPDFSAMTPEKLAIYRDAENRWRASSAAWPVIGEPDSGAAIKWQEVALADRDLSVRVYRPTSTGDGEADIRTDLPLVIHVHGGGFVGTATQCDWTNSHLAAHLPALVVSVEHRLVGPGATVAHAFDDGWDALEHVLRRAAQWGVDPARTAVFGESFGGLISALIAIRARNADLRLAAQVLVNPAVEVTETMYDYPSIVEYAHDPSLAVAMLRLLQELAVPRGIDTRAFSPLYANDLSGLAPALVVVPTRDALADHGRCYAERLRAAGTSVRLTEYSGARHAFLTLPGMEPQAEAAQAEILAFLRAALAE